MPDNADVGHEPLGSDTNLPDTLYHYTDINGLAGIWEKGQIWATNSPFLNDTSEVQLGLKMLRVRMLDRERELLQGINEIWDRENYDLQHDNDVDKEAFDKEREAFQPDLTEVKEIQAAIDKMEGFADSYIACLTEHGDQLSQWRGYAREGYSVGFDTKLLLESLGEERLMRRVRYYDEETNDAYATKMFGIAKGFRRLMLDREDVDDDFRNYIIAKFVMMEAAFFKDSSFREESEVRIVEVSGEPNLFTPHRYGMVARRTIPIPPGAIKTVTVGPSAHEELKQRSLVNYFLEVGFAGADLPPVSERVRPRVYRSKIPFRDW